MKKLAFIGSTSGVGKTSVAKMFIDKFKESVLLDRIR
jgi:guanylate kinase